MIPARPQGPISGAPVASVAAEPPVFPARVPHPAPGPVAGEVVGPPIPLVPPEPAGPTIRVGPHTFRLAASPADAVAVAEADSRALGGAAKFVRYVWVTTADTGDFRAVSFTANCTSHATVVVRPTPVAVGPVLLARIDLRAYAPRLDQLEEHMRLWEDYRFDPKFSWLLTRDMLAGTSYPGDVVPVVRVKRKFEKRVDKGRGPEKVEWRVEKRVVHHRGGDYHYPDDSERPPYKDLPPSGPGGYYVDLKFKTVTPGDPLFEVVTVEEFVDVKVTDVKDVDLLRLLPRHVDPAAYAALCERLGTQAPIITHDYWLTRHLSTIKDDDRANNLFAELYGGRYYEFQLYRRTGAGTDEDRLFEDLGVGNVAAGLTAEKVFDRLRSDQRVAMFESSVTGKPRRTDLLKSLSGRQGTGLLAVTHDIFDKDVDISRHPVMNLLKFTDRGREIIFEKNNGTHGFAITNAAGALQDVAPQDLVEDSEIPRPHAKKLQCAISCVRCHGLGKDDGWKVLRNDVKTMLANRKNDVFGDLTQKDRTLADTIDRITGLYTGDPENRTLPRARDDYAAAVLAATGPWPGSKDQTDVVNLSAARVSRIYGDRVYKTVSPEAALRELGLVLVTAERDPEKRNREAAAAYDLLTPPVKEAAVLGAIPEDPRSQALRSGVSIKRVDWDLTYGFAAPRVQQALSKLVPHQQPQQGVKP